MRAIAFLKDLLDPTTIIFFMAPFLFLAAMGLNQQVTGIIEILLLIVLTIPLWPRAYAFFTGKGGSRLGNIVILFVIFIIILCIESYIF